MDLTRSTPGGPLICQHFDVLDVLDDFIALFVFV